MKRLHVFRSGTHRTSQGRELSFSEQDVTTSASVYDPALCKAPLVIGHPKGGDAPAFGHAASFSAEDGDLYARTERVPQEVIDWGENGHITGVSASFYLPESASNPVPGTYYPRHIGLLGQEQPAIKGLDNWPNFSEDDEETAEIALDFAEADFADPARNADLIGRMMRSIRDWIIDTQGTDTADSVLPNFWIEDLSDEGEDSSSFSEPSPDEGDDADTSTNQPDPTTMDPDDEADTDPDATDRQTPDPERERTLAEREAALDEREDALDERDSDLSEQEQERTQEAQRSEHEDFAERLADDGARILPRHIGTVARTLDALEGAEQTVDFSEEATGEEDTSVADAFRRFLQELPPSVDFSEVAAPGDPGGDGAPGGTDAQGLAQAAADFQEERAQKGERVSMAEAVQHVQDERSDA